MIAVGRDGTLVADVVREHIARRGPMPADRAQARSWVAGLLHAERVAARRAASQPSGVATSARPLAQAPRTRAREHRPSTRSSRAGPSGDDDGGSDPPPRPRRCACGTALGEICFSEQIGEWTCWRCYQRRARDEPFGEPLALEDEGVGERRPRDDGRAPHGALDRVCAWAQRRGLRPVLDAELERVLSECPACHAGETDALGIWRPMVVVPRTTTTTYRCNACGAEEVRDV